MLISDEMQCKKYLEHFVAYKHIAVTSHPHLNFFFLILPSPMQTQTNSHAMTVSIYSLVLMIDIPELRRTNRTTAMGKVD